MQRLPTDRLLHLLDCLLQLGGCAVARLAYIQSPMMTVLVVMLAYQLSIAVPLLFQTEQIWSLRRYFNLHRLAKAFNAVTTVLFDLLPTDRFACIYLTATHRAGNRWLGTNFASS
jgi:hypothetical protein